MVVLFMTSLNLNIDSTKRHKNVWSISIKKIRYSLILLLLNFILFLFLYFIDCEYKKWISYFAISLIISIFFNFLILRKNRTNMLSFISLWIIILYLFCFGQVFLYGFFPNYVATKTNYLFPESENIKRALYFSYWVINFIFVGAIFSSKKSIKFTEISRKSYKTIMLIFLIIFIPLQAYYVLKNISIARTYGYEEVLHSGFSGVYAQLASLYLIGASMLIVFTRKHKTYNAIIYIIELLFIFISMFSGSRIYFVSAAIVITYK